MHDGDHSGADWSYYPESTLVVLPGSYLLNLSKANNP